MLQTLKSKAKRWQCAGAAWLAWDVGTEHAYVLWTTVDNLVNGSDWSRLRTEFCWLMPPVSDLFFADP